jgi:hypothetical protein
MQSMKYLLAATILAVSSGLALAESPPENKGTPSQPPAATPGAPPSTGTMPAQPAKPDKVEVDKDGRIKEPNKGQGSGHDIRTGK